MVSKYTILTEKKLKDLEDIIAGSGRIVSSVDIYNILGGRYSKYYLKKRVYEFKKKRWLISLRRGLYFVSDIGSHGFVSISPFVIAGAFNKDSYISLDSAFSFYNFYEQMLRSATSITAHRSKKYLFQNHTYQYLKIKKRLYFGFKTAVLEGYYIKIADLEKAVLDYLYFKNDTYSMDLFMEILQKAKNSLDLRRLINYAKKFPQTARRKLGFILDLLGIDTKELYNSVSRKGYSKLTSNSRKFNSKWRIYYEDRFTRQAKIGDIK